MRKIFVLLFVVAGIAVACNNPSETPAVASVDSAARAASDTLIPSADTTAKTVDTAAKKPL
ncbi:MAG TPA: hypothetical protein VF939_08135 [Puia sp.]